MFGGVRGAHREAIARYFPALAPLMGVEPPANASTDSVTVLRQVVSSSARAVSASSGEASAAAIRGANLEPLPWTRHAGVDPRQLRLWPDELREELAAQAGQTDAVAAAREKLQQQHEFLATGIPEYNMSMARDDAGDSAAGERGGEKTRGEGAAKWDHNRAFCSAEQAKRFEFVKQIAWYDLGLTQPRKSIFWVCILSFALALWLRIYVHYHAQYLWLSALGAPIYAYTPYWHTVLLKYDSASLSFEAEAALVLIGPAACVAIGGVAMVVALLWHRFGTSFEVGPFTLGHVPADYSRFSAMWIAVTVLDPLLILLVDFATKNFNCFSRAPCDTAFATAQCTCAEGDAFKLVRLVFARVYILFLSSLAFTFFFCLRTEPLFFCLRSRLHSRPCSRPCSRLRLRVVVPFVPRARARVGATDSALVILAHAYAPSSPSRPRSCSSSLPPPSPSFSQPTVLAPLPR
jgi:hypothetical protein